MSIDKQLVYQFSQVVRALDKLGSSWQQQCFGLTQNIFTERIKDFIEWGEVEHEGLHRLYTGLAGGDGRHIEHPNEKKLASAMSIFFEWKLVNPAFFTRTWKAQTCPLGRGEMKAIESKYTPSKPRFRLLNGDERLQQLFDRVVEFNRLRLEEESQKSSKVPIQKARSPSPARRPSPGKSMTKINSSSAGVPDLITFPSSTDNACSSRAGPPIAGSKGRSGRSSSSRLQASDENPTHSVIRK